MIQLHREIIEAETRQHVADSGAQLDLDGRGSRSDDVDVALIELAEAPARRTVGAPHGLNLVSLEELRQLSAMLGDDPRQRDGEVVAQREVGLAAVLAAPEDL